jgi:hypothetical protein
MWNKIFLLTLTISILLMAFLVYYAFSWLGSIGSPAAAVEGYLYHEGLAWKFLCISSVVLLIFANAVLSKYRRSWAMWTTFLYFAVFVILKFFIVDRFAIEFFRENGYVAMVGPFPPLGPIFAVLICAAAAAIVYFDQFLVVRLREKMYPTAISDAQAQTADEAIEKVEEE